MNIALLIAQLFLQPAEGFAQPQPPVTLACQFLMRDELREVKSLEEASTDRTVVAKPGMCI
jgi:hypothetical protein